jgi:type IV pilus assembly protein PilB
MQKGSRRIGEILVAKGFVTEAQLHDALMEQKVSEKFVGMILKEKGTITDHDLRDALAEQFDIPLVDMHTQYIDMELARKFSSSLIVDHKCFPLKAEENHVTFAIVNPLDMIALSKMDEEASPLNVEHVLVTEAEMDEVVDQYRKFVSQSIQRLLKRKPIEGSQT